MISPKLLFQCSSASLLASAVLAAPVFLSNADVEESKCVNDSTSKIQVERPPRPHSPPRIQQPPQDTRSLADRNRAANRALDELSDALDSETTQTSKAKLRWSFQPHLRNNKWVITVEGNDGQKRFINLHSPAATHQLPPLPREQR